VDALSYKTLSLSKRSVEKSWHVVDAQGQPLGRMASEVAKVLRGKHKPSFTPNADCGDCVVIVNAEQVSFSGDKLDKKEYISHSLYPGGQKRVLAKHMMVKKPTFAVEKAIKGMLPKNSLGRAIFKNLFVYEGSGHPHEAQNPAELKF